MEMKYLSDQETGGLCFPVVHVKGIVGLDVNPTTDVSTQDIPLANQYLLTGSKVKITYFDNIVSLSADIQVNGEGLKYLQSGKVIEITNSGFNNTEDVALDTITTLKGVIVGGCMGYVWFKGTKLYIKASCKKLTFAQDVDNPSLVVETETTLTFDKIVGNALTTTKSFAPIKPVQPKGFVIFTISQKVQEFTLGPIEFVGGIDVTTDHGILDFTVDADMINISISNTTRDYSVTVKGNMSSIVYPQSIQVLGLSLNDCLALTWFSVNRYGENRPMIQNTSLRTFSLNGKHRLTRLTSFLSNLPELTSVPNFDTGGVTSLEACFKNDVKLTQLPEMDLSLVNNIKELCYGCKALSYIPNTIDWSNVIEAGSAFHRCISLNTKLTLNTDSLVYAQSMFFSCNALPEVEMSGSRITDTGDTFVECTGLQALVMRGIASTVNIQDTDMITKESIIKFITAAGTAPAGSPSVLFLPQPVSLYEFDNNFIKQVTDKNWKLG